MKIQKKRSLVRALKRVTSSALTAALCFTLAACGGAPAASSSAPASSAPSSSAPASSASSAPASSAASSSSAASTEPVALTMWMGSWWKDQVPTIVDAYKKAAPNVTLTIEALPINGYVDKAVTTILGGDGPDILAIDITQASTFMDKKLLQSWNDQIKDIDLTDFPGTIKACKQGDTYYGLPYRCSSSVMYYNKNMFDAAKVDYPKEGWTYDDYLAIAKKLTVAGKQYGAGIAASKDDPSNVFQSLNPILWSFGGDFVNADQTECTLNTPEAIKGVKFWTELYTKEKVVPEGCINYTATKDIMPMFIDNKVAMFMGGDQNAIEFDKHADLKYGFVTPPKGPVGAGGWMFTVPVTAKHAPAAFAFCKWFLQPEVLGKLTVRIPARLSATKYGNWNKPIYQAIVKSAMNGRLSPTTPKWTDMQTVIITELQNIMQGKKTVEQGCKDMTDQCNTLLHG